ncbi:MAG: hypothetical protein OFPII_05940 [Osedax symbiont Rs1]|nr:MAG: hypothetical protein OFPII_05940 [Osedax symbiont Rs1]
MIKLILVNPLYDAINSKERGFQLGLLYIATFAESKGYKTKLVIGENTTSNIIRILDELEVPPLVGFYVSADNINEVERSCSSLRNLYSNLKIILGGPQARVDEKRLLLENFADFVCIGDGEDCIIELLANLDNVKYITNHYNEITNLAYIKNGEVCYGLKKEGKKANHLDTYPIPDRSLYDYNYLETSSISTSRGCPSKCTFCYEGTTNKIKSHSVKRVLDEMLYLRSTYRTSYISFLDDTFTSNKNRVFEICDSILDNFTPWSDLIWYAEAKVSDLCRTKGMAKKMVDAGLARAQIGSESGNQNILDYYKKFITIEQTIEATELLHDAGISSIFTNFIIGGVHETRETFLDSLNLAKKLMNISPGVVECACTFLSPYIGTDIRNRPEHYGIDIIDPDFKTGSSDSYIFAKSKQLSKSDVLGMGKEFYSEIRSEMLKIYPSLSNDVIKKQIEAANFGLTSNWYQFLTEDRILYKYSEFLKSSYLTIYSDDLDPVKILPIRTFDLELISGNEYFWARRQRKITFPPLELLLMELASGKLSMKEIVDIAYSEFGRSKSLSEFFYDVINFFNSSASEFLICYRRFC